MKIAVYCGSTAGNQTAYAEAAYALGQWMGENGHELVYGGSSTGLMGAVADGVLSRGGSVTGVVPDVPAIKKRVHPRLTKLIETDTVAVRKTRMIELAEAYIALPGGLGTLDEITEILSLQSLDLAAGPVIFYSMNGYYAPLQAALDNIVQSGFGKPVFFRNVTFAKTLAEIAAALGGSLRNGEAAQ